MLFGRIFETKSFGPIILVTGGLINTSLACGTVCVHVLLGGGGLENVEEDSQPRWFLGFLRGSWFIANVHINLGKPGCTAAIRQNRAHAYPQRYT